MKKILLALSFLIFFALNAQAKDIEIKMLNKGQDGVMAFEPAFVKAEVGDSVTFIPTDKSHDAVSRLVPEGASAFKGKINEKFTYKLEKEGVYVYICTPHQAMNMSGIIQVGKAVNLAEANAEIDKIEAKSAINKGRLKKAAQNIK
ncbi:pseudoazurin [Campylobacter sp. MIT 99-7217]|uniref:pseudoazurin n=1 Tax=Campylobacter sp. MIT 99-7217 TaxID=535091 RepID=UPI00115ADD6D|nr:pseudoazurin [Campylobacter sp. MIT 99-7217]TQR30625.1 pseudoazurin [Campylobacter sp. MIT 99-7217]